jgi:hypothetical protein
MIDYSLEKIYFLPGDIVQLKQEIPNKPTMIVVEKKTMTIKPKDGIKSKFFQGMKCMWFTTDGVLLEHIFSTKDLIKLK